MNQPTDKEILDWMSANAHPESIGIFKRGQAYVIVYGDQPDIFHGVTLRHAMARAMMGRAELDAIADAIRPQLQALGLDAPASE